MKGTVKARNASAAELQELGTCVQDTSPVLDIISNAVPVETSLVVR